MRPSRPSAFIEESPMERAIDTKTDRSIRTRYIREADNLHYAAATTTPDQTEHLLPKHLPAQVMRDLERAQLSTSTAVPLSKVEKPDDVLIRDTIVQHISEDEKSTSSEEVVFEEWSEEFRCRRTDEYDANTNRLLRSTIAATSEPIKSDVIKEEYKEKNERIKGHKSYDIVKEVYWHVPAHTVDPTKTTIISSGHPPTHLYEEIAQPSSTMPTTSVSVTSDPRLLPGKYSFLF